MHTTIDIKWLLQPHRAIYCLLATQPNYANVLNMPSQCSVQITPSQYKQTPLACPLNGCCSSELFIAQTNDAGAAADFEGSKIQSSFSYRLPLQTL